jgi:hypothetical protein
VLIVDTRSLSFIALSEFPDIIIDVVLPDVNRISFLLADNSRISVWYFLKLEGKFSYHWDCRPNSEKIFRIDNTPHSRWRSCSTFPVHFHKETETSTCAVQFPDTPDAQIRYFLESHSPHTPRSLLRG